MIVEPTPTSPRSPVRRALRVAGVVLPVGLLAVVVGAGVLGPRSSPSAPATPAVAAATTGTHTPGAASTGVQASPVASPRGPVAGAPGSLSPPTAFGDLGTLVPSTVVAARVAGRAFGELAVAGFLRIVSTGDGCADVPLGPLGPWCQRRAVLADAWWAYGTPAEPGVPVGAIPPHLHATIPVGVRLPSAIEHSGDVAGVPLLQVLVVGRFTPDSTPCDPDGPSCEDGFVVDRVAWANGVRIGLSPLVAAPLAGEARPNPFTLALDDADLPLEAVLVWPVDVASLDPDAAAVAATRPASEPVWYVRVLDGERGASLQVGVRWMLLAERDLRVLGAGRPAGTITESPASPAAPASPAGSG